ncbi:MAG: Heparinase family protein [Candidatus Solibacter sp.]|nr:Heparinase family protein [Candidatus Solibacter sp.]
MLNSGDIARMKKTASAEPWAAKAIAGVMRDADEWPVRHVREFGLTGWALPKEGAGWSHNYVCPDHGVRLQQKEGKNLCPIDGKDYHGWPVDYVVYMHRNEDTARSARSLGLAYQLTGKREYVEKARRIFNAYSDIYLTLPIHDNNNKLDTKTGARIMSQTLSESSWLVPLEFGYDLVRDAIPAEERARFETNVLKGAAAVIRRNQAGKSNWQSWHNAALLGAGLLTGEKELVTLAIDGPGGFKFQMKESVTPDGAWFEGAWGYHFFALNPLLMTREMADRAGIALPEAAALKRMLDAPLASVFPDGTLPNFNDSGYTNLTSEAPYYEIGYRLFGDARYLMVGKGEGRGLEALMWGADHASAGAAAPLTSALMESAGVAVLRVAGSDHTVAVKFGPHGGGHGHYDKLTFVSYANGAGQAADPGTQAYGAKTHATWDKTTVAHNTISVDGKQQAEATGKLLEWNPGEQVTEIRVSAGPVYPGVEIERTLVHTAEYTLDIAEARSLDGTPHLFDFLYHNFGTIDTILPLKPYIGIPQSNGYQHLTQARAAEIGDEWMLNFAQENGKLRVRMLGAPGTTVVIGKGLGPDLRVPVPFVMARRTSTATRFVTMYEPYREAPAVKSVVERSPGAFEVTLAGARDEVSTVAGKFAYRRVAGK